MFSLSSFETFYIRTPIRQAKRKVLIETWALEPGTLNPKGLGFRVSPSSTKVLSISQL